MKKINLVMLLFMLFGFSKAFSQVEYTIKWETSPQACYVVYLKSSTAFSTPLSQIPTAQVTVVAPHGTGGSKFTVVGLTSYEPSMQWVQNARVDAPSENTSKDYISFGFQGATTFNIPANTEVKLFSFKNSGTCLGALQLIENLSDPFSNLTPPNFSNSANTNPGNSITILGVGGDAYTGNYGTGANACPSLAANNDTGGAVQAGTTNNTKILTNDTIDGNPATLSNVTAPTITTNPTKGTATVKADGSIDYTPFAASTGTDVLTYQICDKLNTSTCKTATVTYTISAVPVPVANDDTKTVSAGVTANVVVLANDKNADGTNADLTKSNVPTIVTNPTKGTVTVKSDGSIDYTPNVGATGTDTFVYRLCDKTNSGSCDNAIVTLNLPTCPTPNCGTATIIKN